MLAVYLLTMAGRLTSGDGETVYQTTRALVTQGRLAVEPRPETAVGRGGRSYGKYGLAQSLVQTPFFVVGHGVGRLAGATDDRAARFAVGMTNGVVSATLVGVFWLLLRALELGRRPATAIALVFAFATLTWPYARADFAEPLQAASLVGAFFCLVRWRRRAALRWAALAGGAAALAFLTKAASLVLLPPLGIYFAVALWQRFARGPAPRAALTHAAAAAAPLLAAGLLQGALNFYRFGSVAEFGYGSEPATGFTTPVITGIQYLLMSSGKGLFLFAPPTLLGLALLPVLARRGIL